MDLIKERNELFDENFKCISNDVDRVFAFCEELKNITGDLIDLTKTAASIKEILFTVSIYWNPNDSNDPRRKYNFGQVRDAYIQIKNAITGEVICRYDLDEDFSTDKGVEFGRLYRRGSEWKFQAVGEAHTDGLEPICQKYASKFM